MIVSITTITIPSSTAARIGQLVLVLASDRPGEVSAAGAAIVRALDRASADIHVLANVVEQGLRNDAPPPSIRRTGGWRSDLALCKARLAMLTKREREFISSIASRSEPTAKPQTWLRDIADRQRGDRGR